MENTKDLQSIIVEADTNSPTGRTTTTLNPYTGSWTENEVIHLLKRTMFGASKADIDYFKSKTLGQTINELLNPTAAFPSPPVKEYSSASALTQPDTLITAGQTWVNDPNVDGTIAALRRSSFKKWWMGIMINQDRSIREKIYRKRYFNFLTKSWRI